MNRLFTILMFLLIAIPSINAQVTLPSRATITAELEKRNIDPIEFERRMNQRGVSLDNIDPTNAAELQRVQRVAEEVMNEMTKDGDGVEETMQEETFQLDTIPEYQEERIEEIIDDEEPKQIEEVKEKPKEREVKTWGQQIFRNNQIQLLESASSTNPPDGYILGSGDKIVVSIFGIAQATEAHTINEVGYIAPDRMQPVSYTHLTLPTTSRV